MLPEFHWLPSAVAVCVVLSSLSQLTVVPTETVSGLAPNAVVVCVDEPLGIVTVVLPGRAAVGAVDDELHPLQAARPIEVTRIAANRTDMIR
jgi:hypothetical protein